MMALPRNQKRDELLKRVTEIRRLIEARNYESALRQITEAQREIAEDETLFSFKEDLRQLENLISQEFVRRFSFIEDLFRSGQFDEASHVLRETKQLLGESAVIELFLPLRPRLEELEERFTFERRRYYEIRFLEARQLVEERRLEEAERSLRELRYLASAHREDFRYPVVHDIEVLSERVEREIAERNAGIATVTLRIEREASIVPTRQRLTPVYLEKNFLPYVHAVAEVQHVIDEIRGRRPVEVAIKAFSQRSPISVSIDGAAEALGLIRETVVPWRRKHAEEMARLLEAEKQADIENKKAEILERRARAQKERAEAEKLASESVRQREEAEKMKLENEKLRLELYRTRIELALDILSRVAPRLSENERIAYVVKLLSPLETLVLSELSLEQ